MNLFEMKKAIQNGEMNEKFMYLYGKGSEADAAARYIAAIDEFYDYFGYGEGEFYAFSAPGRTELCGNHTDHNYGKVLAGAVNIDVIGIVCKNQSGTIRVKSRGHAINEIRTDELEPVKEEEGKSNSILRGVAARIGQLGYTIGSFDAYTVSNVPAGSGLSSSAAYECLLGCILSVLYNEDKINNVELAQISQFAENVYFGKPCGLMDQLTIATGSAVKFDFKDIENPGIEKLDFDFQSTGYALCITNTGGSHADLTDDYAAVRGEMEGVAAFFGKKVLREVDKQEVIANIPALREKLGDRAVLRAMHFYGENEKVEAAAAALKKGDFEAFLEQISASGRSSYMYNQNVYSPKAPAQQGVSLGINIAERVLGKRGAFRVHGGGFAGTTQAFVPADLVARYQQEMEAVFGENSCWVLSIRPCGPIQVI
ncbi:MAG: galactokinase [Clostridia bacterium]|nr:galactokinase [Clostridia bacterium]